MAIKKATNKGCLTSFKKTTNPNVSPIGKMFGVEYLVLVVGLEPTRIAPHDFESCASANFATPAQLVLTTWLLYNKNKLVAIHNFIFFENLFGKS